MTNICQYDKSIAVVLQSLFEQTGLLFHAHKEWAETLHEGVQLTASMRVVLELVLREGPTPVPEIARARLVSRQHIQHQVDALLERKLVRREPNPAHKRSALIVLADRGRALIQNMRADELHALSRLQAGTSDSAIREAAQVLAAWRKTLNEDAAERKR